MKELIFLDELIDEAKRDLSDAIRAHNFQSTIMPTEPSKTVSKLEYRLSGLQSVRNILSKAEGK